MIRRRDRGRPRARPAANTAATGLNLFVARKEILLAEVAADRRTARDVLDVLELYYATLTREFLRSEPAAYGVWHERGPRRELNALRAAFADPAAWQRLIERFGAR